MSPTKIVAYEQVWEASFNVRMMLTKRFVAYLWNALQHIKMRQVLHRMNKRFRKKTKKPKADKPKKKEKNWKCGHCGMKNDHYAPTCPKKLAEADRNQICYHVCLANGHPAAYLVEVA